MGKKLIGITIIALAAYGAVEAFKLGKAKLEAKKAIKATPTATT